MHGVSHRKSYEQRQARILEATRYPSPIGAGIMDASERSLLVAEAAEQRRLLRETGLLPPRESHSFVERVAARMRQFVASISASGSDMRTNRSTPDPA